MTAQFRVRNFCCALHTFVRVVAILATLGYLVAALVAGGLWAANRRLPLVENDDGSGRPSIYTTVFVLTVFFATIGVAVNLLVLLAVEWNKRMLMLPWLVYHAMVILGCFALGLYIALHFTVVSDKPGGADKNRRVFAVFCLFPTVVGIFLIFVWILFDQLFIQMKAMKMMGIRAVSSSNLSQFRGNVSLSASNPSIHRHKKVIHANMNAPPSTGVATDYMTPDQQRKYHQQNFYSLPRHHHHHHAKSTPRRTVHQDFSYNFDFEKFRFGNQHQNAPEKPTRTLPRNRRGHQYQQEDAKRQQQKRRTRSLENVLDGADTESTTATVTGPHVWISGARPGSTSSSSEAASSSKKNNNPEESETSSSSLSNSSASNKTSNGSSSLKVISAREWMQNSSKQNSPVNQNFPVKQNSPPVNQNFPSIKRNSSFAKRQFGENYPLASFCTIDRTRLNKRDEASRPHQSMMVTPSDMKSFRTFKQNQNRSLVVQPHNHQPQPQSQYFQTLPRKLKFEDEKFREIRPQNHFSRSADNLDSLQYEEDDRSHNQQALTYIGDIVHLEELKAVADINKLSKSVTIHPRVTEYLYNQNEGYEEGELQAIRPHNPLHIEGGIINQSFEEDEDFPPPPPPLVPPPPPAAKHELLEEPQVFQHEPLETRLMKQSVFSSDDDQPESSMSVMGTEDWSSQSQPQPQALPVVPKTKKSYTKDQLIDYYCQMGDSVPL